MGFGIFAGPLSSQPLDGVADLDFREERGESKWEQEDEQSE
jgi:hypothetical protein